MSFRTMTVVKGIGRFEDELSDVHFAAIGRLVNAFTEIDSAAARLLMDLLDLPHEVALALKGDGRNETTSSLIKRISQLRHPNDKFLAYIDLMLTDIGRLRKIRDVAAHWLCSANGRDMYFSNAHAAKTFESRYALLSVDDLLECERYCGMMLKALRWVAIPLLPFGEDKDFQDRLWGALRALRDKPRAITEECIHTYSIPRKRTPPPQSYPE